MHAILGTSRDMIASDSPKAPSMEKGPHLPHTTYTVCVCVCIHKCVHINVCICMYPYTQICVCNHSYKLQFDRSPNMAEILQHMQSMHHFDHSLHCYLQQMRVHVAEESKQK